MGPMIDYLEWRDDIAADKVAFLGWSYGGIAAPSILALEERIKTTILISAEVMAWPGLDPLTDNINYLPRVRQPTLVLSGEYDYICPLQHYYRRCTLVGE